MTKKMKAVIYESKNGNSRTFHPQLGELISGESFEIPEETAKKYIDSGLLKPAVKPAGVKVTNKQDDKGGNA